MEFYRAGAQTLLVKVAQDALTKLSDNTTISEGELVALRDGMVVGELE